VRRGVVAAVAELCSRHGQVTTWRDKRAGGHRTSARRRRRIRLRGPRAHGLRAAVAVVSQFLRCLEGLLRCHGRVRNLNPRNHSRPDNDSTHRTPAHDPGGETIVRQSVRTVANFRGHARTQSRSFTEVRGPSGTLPNVRELPPRYLEVRCSDPLSYGGVATIVLSWPAAQPTSGGPAATLANESDGICRRTSCRRRCCLTDRRRVTPLCLAPGSTICAGGS
jgi:hypothetical protein